MRELSVFLYRILGAFIAGAAFGLAFQVPLRHAVSSGFTATIGWSVYLLALAAGWNQFGANYAATACVALVSQVLARKKYVPATVFLVPGVIPLVPGGGMYRTVWSMFYDPLSTSAYLNETLQMAGAIALGIFTVDTIFRMPHRKKQTGIKEKTS